MKIIILSLFTLALINSIMAKDCSLSTKADHSMTYDIKEIKIAKDCTSINLTLINTDEHPKSMMGHNIVISETKDKQAILAESLKAGLSNDYLVANDKRIIAHTILLGGGETNSIKLATKNLKKGTDYSFYCTFPGHAATMNGKLILE